MPVTMDDVERSLESAHTKCLRDFIDRARADGEIDQCEDHGRMMIYTRGSYYGRGEARDMHWFKDGPTRIKRARQLVIEEKEHLAIEGPETKLRRR